MRFDLISNSIKRRHNKINTHVMYLIHSSQKTKLYLKQIPNGHDEMATRGRWFLGQYSPKLTSAFDFSSAFVFDITLFHTFVHSRERVKAAFFVPCQPMYLWAVWFVISQILRVWLTYHHQGLIPFAKYVIVSCELTDLIPGISQHFVSTVVIEENTQV